MRCVDLGTTWTDLVCWLELHDVLVLPPLVADMPLARLDTGSDGSGDTDDVARAVDRLRLLIKHFDVRAVYVERVDGVPAGTGAVPGIAVLAIRVLAAGAVHELKLFATWYVEQLEAEPAHSI
ncbi:MAG TPA: hypothetical protein VFX16_18330 [Pseudonocardiaceae bacterium]|nr:hypothetical protein [Pseudonocardiaceae bacterium]